MSTKDINVCIQEPETNFLKQMITNMKVSNGVSKKCPDFFPYFAIGRNIIRFLFDYTSTRLSTCHFSHVANTVFMN